MAGWSILTDGSVLDCLEVLRNLESNGLGLDLDASMNGCVDDGKDRLRCLFDQILSIFLKEVSVGVDIRPLPAMLGDGRCVDLLRLFLVVREKGGYDAVSKNRLWAVVAEESNLGSAVASAVKLIYLKYLDMFDRWLRKIFRNKGVGDGLVDCGGKLGLFSADIETEFKSFLSNMSDQKNKDEICTRFNLERNELSLLPRNDNDTHEGRSSPVSDVNKKCVDDDEEVVISDPVDVDENALSRKRKRESLLGMLDWVTEIAMNPCNPAIGTLPEWYRWKAYGGKEFWEQALLAREAVFLGRNVGSSAQQTIFQKKQKMHPSMYEDHIGSYQQSSERLRISQRLLFLKSSGTKSLSELGSDGTRCITGKENQPYKGSHVAGDSSTGNSFADLLNADHLVKQVPVSPLFQADVPEWTGVPSESDSKWLGTKVWPLDRGENNMLIERDPIGKGRPDSCGCQLPGSIECVGFHVSMKRNKMSWELGSAFYHWKFDIMGENVSLQWTKEEEGRFKAIVRSNPPSQDKCFWNLLVKCFHTKSREELVSYFFNVFLLQRRSYQNRVTPNNINSDDEESEFVSRSNAFGNEAV